MWKINITAVDGRGGEVLVSDLEVENPFRFLDRLTKPEPLTHDIPTVFSDAVDVAEVDGMILGYDLRRVLTDQNQRVPTGRWFASYLHRLGFTETARVRTEFGQTRMYYKPGRFATSEQASAIYEAYKNER